MKVTDGGNHMNGSASTAEVDTLQADVRQKTRLRSSISFQSSVAGNSGLYDESRVR